MDFLQGNEGRQDSSNLQFLIGDKCRGKRYLDTNTPSNKSLEGTANSAAFNRETFNRETLPDPDRPNDEKRIALILK